MKSHDSLMLGGFECSARCHRDNRGITRFQNLVFPLDGVS